MTTKKHAEKGLSGKHADRLDAEQFQPAGGIRVRFSKDMRDLLEQVGNLAIKIDSKRFTNIESWELLVKGVGISIACLADDWAIVSKDLQDIYCNKAISDDAAAFDKIMEQMDEKIAHAVEVDVKSLQQPLRKSGK